jgi:hypothetical protein
MKVLRILKHIVPNGSIKHIGMEIDKIELHRLYMEWVNKVADEFDWKTHFGPEEIVYAIANILETNPQLIKNK